MKQTGKLFESLFLSMFHGIVNDYQGEYSRTWIHCRIKWHENIIDRRNEIEKKNY